MHSSLREQFLQTLSSAILLEMTSQEREKLMSAIYEINSDRDEIIIRLPRGLMNEQELSQLLDYIEIINNE